MSQQNQSKPSTTAAVQKIDSPEGAPFSGAAAEVLSRDPRWSRLLGLYGPAFQVAVRVLGQTRDGEDVVQNAYLDVLRRMPDNLSLDDVQSWFFAVVVNTARDHLRSNARRRQREAQAMHTNVETNEKTTPDRELIALLQTAVAALDETERLPVVLCHEQGMTQTAAAQVLGISPRLVSVHLAKGLTSLRNALARSGVTATPVLIVSQLGHTAPAWPGSLGVAVQQLALQATCGGATVTASGGAAAVGAASSGVKTALAVKWTLALLLVSATVITASVAIFQAIRPAPMPAAIAAPAVAPAPAPTNDPQPPASAQAAQPSEALKKVLDTPIDTQYNRDYLVEVLDDLNRRTGLNSAFPPSLSKAVQFTLAQKQIVVHEVLERLAKAGGLELEYQNDDAYFFKKADDKTIVDLQQTLKEGDATARRQAVFALSNLGDQRIYPLLIHQLSDSDPAVVKQTLGALRLHQALLSHHQIGPALFDAAAKAAAVPGQDNSQVYLSVVLIGATRDPRAVDWLTGALKDPAFLPKAYVVDALGFSRDPHAVDALLGLIQKPTPSLLLPVIAALGRSRDPRAVAPLIELLKSPNAQVRSDAIYALAATRDPRASQALGELAHNANDTQMYLAMLGLGRIRDAGAMATLTGLLKDPDTTVRKSAADILCMSPDARAVDALIPLLEDPNSSVRGLACMALGKTRDLHAVDALIKLWKNPQAATPISPDLLLHVLGDSRDSRATDLIIAALKDANAGLQPDAAYALGISRDPRGVDLLIQLTQDQNAAVRAGATRGMGEVFDPRSIDVLIHLLKDPNLQVRTNAVWGLTNSYEPRALEALVTHLKGENAAVCSIILGRMLSLKDPRAQAAVKQYGPGPTSPVTPDHAPTPNQDEF